MKTYFLYDTEHTRHFYLVLGLPIVLAWGLLAVWQRSAYAELLGHESFELHGFPPLFRLGAFLLSWSLMTVAMMLPGSLPLLDHSVQPVRQRIGGNRLVGLIVLGYLLPWALFGLLVYLGDGFLHEMAEPEAPLAAFSDLLAPMIVLAAGLYQLTPLKRSYMRRCRTPHAQIFQSTGEKISQAGALKQGIRLGGFCVGSCWSLMLLMSAIGQHRLDWMLALGCIMAAERLAPWGHRLAWLVGFVLVIWAVLWVLI